MSKRVSRLAGMMLLLVAFVATVPTAGAQVITGSISGFVRDASGAVVTGATVTVTNKATGESRKTTTDDRGEYTISQMPIGTYSVSVEQTGFKKFLREDVELHVNDRLGIDVDLEAGNVSETVTVVAGTPLVKTETQTIEHLVTGEQIRELPLNNRNFAQLTQLVPGVSSIAGSTMSTGGLASVAVSINGNRPTSINWSIDGARNVDTGSNNTLFNYPSVDSIAEFKVLTNAYDAQFGRNGGGVVNVVTRSGGRDFHGGAYEFLRNDKLQARNPFVTTPIRGLSPNECFAAGATPASDERCKFKGPLRYNNFGYTIGGPVWIPKVYGSDRDRTFFFFSQEFRRIRESAIRTGTYPTADQRAGIFTTAIKDPTTGQNFANNRIPTNRFDPNAVAIMAAFIPLPNAPAEGPNTFRTIAPNPTNFHQELIRVDHNFSDDWRIWGRYIHDSTATQEAGGLFNGIVFPGVSTTNTVTPADNVVVRLTSVISPTLLNEVGYDFARNAITSELVGNALRSNFPNIQIPEIFPGSPSGGLPAIGISGFSAPLGVLAPFANDNPSHTFTDNVTWTKGSHTFRFGGSISHEAKNENSQGGSTPGNFTFNGTVTNNAFADFLLGRAATYVEDQTDVTVHERYNSYEWYFQDSWKVSPNLTFNYGVRHSIFLNPTDTNNTIISFLPERYNPAFAVRLAANGTIIPGSGDRFNGIIFAGENSPFGRRVQSTTYKAFGPRIGFAWDPHADGKTSIRGGYGIYHDRSLIGIVEQNGFADPRANLRVTIDNALLSNPSGGVPNTAIRPIGLTTTGNPFDIPTTQHWSLSVQRQFLKDFIAEVTYAGSGGNHLLRQVQINLAPPLEATRRGVGVNFVRPFIGYGNINERQTTATSRYHGLQTSLSKRLAKGVLFGVNYTWAKTLTDSSDDRGNTPQDLTNFAIERGRASFQRQHVFSFNYVYEVPFPKDNFMHSVLGGWQVSGITYLWSGLPLTVFQSGDPLNYGASGITRPNLVGNPEGQETVTQWFNTAAFATVTDRPGTAGRGIITGPGVNNWDITFAKNWRWKEALRVRFSADFVNAFNHRILGNPNTTATFTGATQTNANFGRITATGRDPRIVQFGLKLNF